MVELKKTVLITDCSTYFGKEFARFLKEKGWQVYAAAQHSRDVELLKTEGFESFTLDVASQASIEKTVKDVLLLSGGSLSALVLYCGYCQVGALGDLSRAEIRNQFENTVFGPIELASFLIPIFRKQNFGRIIFVNTLNGKFIFPFMGAYGAARSAFESFAVAARRELFHTNVRVSCIASYCMGHPQDDMVRVAQKDNESNSSIHKATYVKLLKQIDSAVSANSNKKFRVISRVIQKVMESNVSSPRIVVGWQSKIRDFANRFLPDKVQDFILRKKMRFFYHIT
jgi:NAD(P)-dependent dehydrogenase (short-subunit alcohol dehydrogenase family)